MREIPTRSEYVVANAMHPGLPPANPHNRIDLQKPQIIITPEGENNLSVPDTNAGSYLMRDDSGFLPPTPRGRRLV